MTSHAYDDLFERYANGVPLAYLRALTGKESGFNPRAHHTSGARGLMQITAIVLTDYNLRHGAQVTEAQLFDPATNIKIGCETLARIVAAYRASGVPELAPNWQSRSWVELLTFGWNAGYSARAGVIFVARELASQRRSITIDTVSAAAGRIRGASHNLVSAAKVAWCKGVAVAYFGELAGAPPPAPRPPPPAPAPAPRPAPGRATESPAPSPRPPPRPGSSNAMAPIGGSSSAARFVAGVAAALGLGVFVFRRPSRAWR